MKAERRVIGKNWRAIELARPTLTDAEAKEGAVEQISPQCRELRGASFALRKQVNTDTRAEDQRGGMSLMRAKSADGRRMVLDNPRITGGGINICNFEG